MEGSHDSIFWSHYAQQQRTKVRDGNAEVHLPHRFFHFGSRFDPAALVCAMLRLIL